MKIDLDALRAAHPVASVAASVVNLKRSGNELVGLCPFHGEKSPSFYIFAGGQRFHCFGCGASGDVLDFVMAFHGVRLREAAEMITGGNLPVAPASPTPRVRPEAEDDRDTTAEARTIWDAAIALAGTPAEAYLRRRGITMNLPACLRFSRIRYGSRGPLHPALICAITGKAGDLVGIQRTYLTEDGSKAAFEKVKLSLGRIRGGAIHLGPAAASMLVTEGLEDGLTLAQALGRSVWVAAGTSMLPAMSFPASVRAIVIGADGDAPGETAAQKAAEAYTARGRAVRIMRPAAPYKDFNAELMAVKP
jgi:DNA primase